MRQPLRLILFIFFLLTFSISLQAQDTLVKAIDEENANYIAEELIEDENFVDAIKLYNRMLADDSLNYDLHFKLGFCYLNTSQEKMNATTHFESALAILDSAKRKPDQKVYNEIKFYLARAYHVNGNYERAIELLNAMKYTAAGRDKALMQAIDRQILTSQTSLELVNSPVEMSVSNLGAILNSANTDHSPVVSADESIIIFTSRREGSTGNQLAHDGEFFEDLYISYFEDGEWSIPRNMGLPINSEDHEASISLSADGTKLFIYKSEDAGSIYFSESDGENWTSPVKLNENVNTRARETHASLSTDGNLLYFTSDRKGGIGGLDIYVSRKMPDGSWGEARNLGPTINTELDEEGPFIHPDGVTLYFSSKGHKGMGGFDIFKSKLNEFNTWTYPENIGYPINTVDNDVFFTPTPEGTRAYYSSLKEDGFGRSDIYLMHLPEIAPNALTLVKGRVSTCTGKIPPLTITITDSKSEDVIGIYKSNKKTGRFVYFLNKPGIYKIDYEVNGTLISSEKIEIEEGAKYQEFEKLIKAKTGDPCDEKYILSSSEQADDKRTNPILFQGVYYDQMIEIRNILFPFGKANAIDSNLSLDSLANYLIRNTDAVIEVGAYADAIGSEQANLNITKLRANVVIDYLVNKGVNRKQLIPMGYGESNPVALNTLPDGNWHKEAQNFNRRIEFRVIKQGKEKILVKPMDNIPADYKNPKYVWKM